MIKFTCPKDGHTWYDRLHRDGIEICEYCETNAFWQAEELPAAYGFPFVYAQSGTDLTSIHLIAGNAGSLEDLRTLTLYAHELTFRGAQVTALAWAEKEGEKWNIYINTPYDPETDSDVTQVNSCESLFDAIEILFRWRIIYITK